MSPSERMVAATRKIACATSIIRTRGQDADRLEVHGGVNGDLVARQAAAVARIEAVAERLEKAIS